MSFLDALVYAHHHHRRSIENPVNFGDCMKGRIRFMTAILLTLTHIRQLVSLDTCLHQNFRPPNLKARYPYHPNDRSTTRTRLNDFRG